MIVDRIDRRDVYNNFVPNWKEAFDFALSLKDAVREDMSVNPFRQDCICTGTGRSYQTI